MYKVKKIILIVNILFLMFYSVSCTSTEEATVTEDSKQINNLIEASKAEDINSIQSKVVVFDDKVYSKLIDEYSKMDCEAINQIIYFESISFFANYYILNDKPDDVKELILILTEQAESLWDLENGGYWDSSAYPSYMRTSMYTRALADTLIFMKEDFSYNQRAYLTEILTRNSNWLCGNQIALVKKNGDYDLSKHSESANQNIAKISALSKAYIVLKDEKYLEELRMEFDWINSNQWFDDGNDEGYYTEHSHFDIGYSQVQMLLLNDIYFETGRNKVRDKIEKIWNCINKKVISEEFELDTSDSFIVRDKYATLGIPSVFFYSLVDEMDIGKALIDKKYHNQLQDGLLDVSSGDSLVLTTSDYYLRIGSILKYSKGYLEYE
ncbi:hypothetical protein WG909_07555 [Peptostreptococcaceae bacterium AGR-M142]